MNEHKLPTLAILGAARTPFCKAFTELSHLSAVDLGVHALQGAVRRSGLSPDDIEETVFGNVAGPPDAANVARVIALEAGIPTDRLAHTVNRNCGSGMEALIGGWQILAERRADLVVVGGTESMSNIPLLFRPGAVRNWKRLRKARSLAARTRTLAAFRPSHFAPLSALELGLRDPVSGMNMGETAEQLADEFAIARIEQDRYALSSHRRAAAAQDRCFLSGEIEAVDDSNGTVIDRDNGIRSGQSLEQLSKLKPIFRKQGTVTAGNSCQLTDGAAAAVLVDASRVDQFAASPIGYISGYAIAGCDPRRMGLGPVYAAAKLLKKTGLELSDFDLIELNEAFAAQVIACRRAAESLKFAQQELGLNHPLGSFCESKLNPHGGAIALGHPVGSTGMRLVITLLRALTDAGKHRGLATLCIGGGQGMAIMVQTDRE